MGIFLFTLGVIFGFGSKFGVDKYAEFKENEKKMYRDMENILTNFRAIEKLKELDKEI